MTIVIPVDPSVVTVMDIRRLRRRAALRYARRGGGKQRVAYVDYDPYWDNVVFLAKFNGVEGATTWTDDSDGGHGTPSTWGGTAVIDEDVPLFGESTLLLDGDSDYVAWADHADWLMGTSVPFCVDAWVYLPVNTDAVKTIGGQYRVETNQRSWRLNVQDAAGGNVFRFLYSLDGTNASFIDSDDPCPADEFVHVAVTRTAAGTINMWVNGVKQADEDTGVTTAFHNSTHTMDIGRVFSTVSIHFWPGSIADFRVTKGTPRFTAAFTPPTARAPTNAIGDYS